MKLAIATLVGPSVSRYAFVDRSLLGGEEKEEEKKKIKKEKKNGLKSYSCIRMPFKCIL